MLEGLGEGTDRARVEWFATEESGCGLLQYIKFIPVVDTFNQ